MQPPSGVLAVIIDRLTRRIVGLDGVSLRPHRLRAEGTGIDHLDQLTDQPPEPQRAGHGVATQALECRIRGFLLRGDGYSRPVSGRGPGSDLEPDVDLNIL